MTNENKLTLNERKQKMEIRSCGTKEKMI